MSNPFEIINQLRSTNSKLEKEAILLSAWNNGNVDFFKGVKLALDPLITFGVKQVPFKDDDTGTNLSLEDFTKLTTSLSTRTLTGHAARDAILNTMDLCDTNTWNLFYRLILTKDLKSGVSETTINKVLRKVGDTAKEYIIPEFPYQRCCLPKDTKIEGFSWSTGVYSQKKLDGLFCSISFDKFGEVRITSRQGNQFPSDEFSNLVIDAASVFGIDTQTHGELLVYRDGRELPRKIGNGILNHVTEGGKFQDGDVPVYVVWDQIPLSSVVSKGTCSTPYTERFKELSIQIESRKLDSIKMVETKIVHSLEEAREHYKEVVSEGFEGTIFKEPTATWRDGTSKFCVKLKTQATVDLLICGFNQGNGKNESTFGSILCKTSDGLLEVNVSGFIEKKDPKNPSILTRQEIWDMRDKFIGTIMAVTGNEIINSVSNNGLYSIFLPRFEEFRKDKTVADTLEQVKAQFEQALK